jgi:hypothetical protein
MVPLVAYPEYPLHDNTVPGTMQFVVYQIEARGVIPGRASDHIEAGGAAMDPDSKRDYDNHPSGAGVVLYNQHLNAAEHSEGQELSGEEAVQSLQEAAHATPGQAEHATQQSHPGTQSPHDAQDERQTEETEQPQQAQQAQQQQPPPPPPQPPQPPQPDLEPPATQLRQAPPPHPPQQQPQPQQSQQPRVPSGGQKGAAAALMPGLGRAEEGDGEAGPAAAAGVIFGCTNSTYEECFRLSMVGLPRKYLPLVESIVAGHTLIFLFNFSDRQLHGVYIATSAGQACHAMHHAMQLCNAAMQCTASALRRARGMRTPALPRGEGLHTHVPERVQPYAPGLQPRV